MATRPDNTADNAAAHTGAPTIADLVGAMDAIAPEYLAEEWDNVGLIVGDPGDALRGPVLLTIDLRDAIVDEAIALKAGAIVAYHPPIFHPTKRLVASDARQRPVLRAARAGIALYSPHTALDAAPGALCDWLADMALLDAPANAPSHDPSTTKLADRRALRPAGYRPPGQQVKIVTFVPESHAERVRHALASAGAGMIGDYAVCSFSVAGSGTFLGNEHAKPFVGKPQQLEHVDEVRLEMVCGKRALALALTTLRQFHPYEEPPIDVYELMPQPDRAAGAGRRLTLDQPLSLARIAQRLKANLRLSTIGVAPSPRLAPSAAEALNAPIKAFAVCPGSGSSLVDAAIAQGCQALITGELSHHETLRALDMGLSIIVAGHTNTERGYLPHLAARLAEAFPASHPVVSAVDADPVVST
jgi:dinuclear metal center YbgI/SA1388 family protein